MTRWLMLCLFASGCVGGFIESDENVSSGPSPADVLTEAPTPSEVPEIPEIPNEPDPMMPAPEEEPADPPSTLPASCPMDVPMRALWVWQTSTITSASERAAFFTLAAAEHLNTVYIQVSSSLMPATNANTSPLGTFIAEAATRCIEVELLIGRPDWTLADFHSQVVTQAQQAKAFTLALTGARPTALHLDIEPHGVKGVASGGVTWTWNNDGQSGRRNDRKGMINQLLDLYDKLRPIVQGVLVLNADIPFWFDGSTGINPLQRVKAGVNVGSPRLASELAIDALNVASLMSYRDSTSGVQSISATELAYAQSKGKKIVMGVETKNVNDDVVSFYEETPTLLHQVVTALLANNAANPGFAGVAIHDLTSLKLLLAK